MNREDILQMQRCPVDEQTMQQYIYCSMSKTWLVGVLKQGKALRSTCQGNFSQWQLMLCTDVLEAEQNNKNNKQAQA